MSSSGNIVATHSASAALIGLPIPAILAIWGISLQRITPAPISPPLRLANLFIRIAAPIYALLGLTFSIVLPAAIASVESPTDTRRSGPSRDADENLLRAGSYLLIVGDFATYTGDILLAMGLYLATIASVYTVRGKMTWWKLFRIDAPAGGFLLWVLMIAYFGRMLHISITPGAAEISDIWLPRLVFIVDLTLALLAASCLGAMIYVWSKLNEKGYEGMKVAMGKTTPLIFSACLVWLIRCCYGAANMIKIMTDDYLDRPDEARAALFIYPIFQHWLFTVVLALLVFAGRNSVWSDESIQPTTANPVIGGQQQQQQPLPPYYGAPGQPVPMMPVQQQYPPVAHAGVVQVQYVYLQPGQAPPQGHQQPTYYDASITPAPQPQPQPQGQVPGHHELK